MGNTTHGTRPDPRAATPGASRRVRPESEKYTGQAPPEDIGGGAPTDGVDFGAEVSPEERRRREDELTRTDEGF